MADVANIAQVITLTGSGKCGIKRMARSDEFYASREGNGK
jgi:hypothetical protein